MENILQKPVSAFMNRNVMSVQKNESLKNLFALMEKHGILGVPVVDHQHHAVGMVTESDLMKHFTTLKSPRGINLLGSLIYLEDPRQFNQQLKEHCAETVGEIMKTPVITLPQTAPLQEALDTMVKARVNRLPITDKNGKLAGLLTRTDILHQLSKLVP